MNETTPQGGTVYDHLIQLYNQTGIIDDMLNFGWYIKELDYIVDWFYQLGATRAISESGPGAITFRDIIAWRELLLIDIHPWEVQAIRSLDDAYLSVVAEWQEKRLRKNA